MDLPTAIAMAMQMLGILLIGSDSRQYKDLFVCLLLNADRADSTRIQSALAVLRLGRRAALASGAITFLVSLLLMLGNMADPASMGAGIAISLIAIFNGLVLSELVFSPLIFAMGRKLDQKRAAAGETE